MSWSSGSRRSRGGADAEPGRRRYNRDRRRPHCGALNFPALSQDFLEIRGARLHNLKGVDLRLPHNRLIVFTGVSGSGKSSLVFDTVYAEGQRRYVESLSAYARQFLERMEKPEVDEIVGVAPAVAIRQKNTTRNPRSTVATATEVYDFLRLLFARAGRTYCENCDSEVYKDDVDRSTQRVLGLEERSRWYALFPLFEEPEGLTDALKARLAELRGRGFNRLYQGGQIFEFSNPESLLDVDFKQPVYALVDRISISPSMRERVADAIEICYRESHEAVFESATASPPEQVRFSERFECRNCGIIYPEPEPRLFSFNSPAGACPRCQGFGNTVDYDLARVIPDRFLTLAEGAVDPWSKPKYAVWERDFLKAAKRAGVPSDVPYHELSSEHRDWVLNGDENFGGISGFFSYLETKKYKMSARLMLARYRGYTRCVECNGARLRKEAFQVRVGGKHIGEVTALSLAEAHAFFDQLKVTGERAKVADQLMIDIRSRLRFLNDVGLEYLTLDRLTSTLSGGEAQRIQLATSLGSRLVGACYVLDEPSIGLHPRDTGRLIRILKDLRDLGNTILVVEHDSELMTSSDLLVDIGPGAGEHGGEVVFKGTPKQALRASKNGSVTTRYLAGKASIAIPKKRRKPSARGWLKIVGAVRHNLKNIDVGVPRGLLTVVTGVSGSGKSTLVHEVIRPAWEISAKKRDKETSDTESLRLPCRKVTGARQFEELVVVDQSPIGRTPRSNPATYVKAFDGIRQLFASVEEAKRRRRGPGYFSFNVPGGRCETCQGEGTTTVEMQFLADVKLVCEDCGGKRYSHAALQILYQGKSIRDVLEMTIDEAVRFFASEPKITSRLLPLREVGLGYLRLGQPATTLSGGEAQRVKLGAHIGSALCAGTLYVFDEPTTGLHFDDIAKLLAAFERLIDEGGSVLVIEHNLDVIKYADWVIDLGPEGGSGGGEIVATGAPEKIAACKTSHTGGFLRKVLPNLRP